MKILMIVLVNFETPNNGEYDVFIEVCKRLGLGFPTSKVNWSRGSQIWEVSSALNV